MSAETETSWVPKAAMTETPLLVMDAVTLAQSKLDTFALEPMELYQHVPWMSAVMEINLVPKAAMTETPLLVMDAVTLAQSKLDTFALEPMELYQHVPWMSAETETSWVPKAAMTETPLLVMDAVTLAQSKLDTFALEPMDQLRFVPPYVAILLYMVPKIVIMAIFLVVPLDVPLIQATSALKLLVKFLLAKYQPNLPAVTKSYHQINNVIMVTI
jgi:hypothetical protein